MKTTGKTTLRSPFRSSLRLPHLIRISDLDDAAIAEISQRSVERCELFDKGITELESRRTPPDVGMVFLEASTRTRVSFERAAQIGGRRTILLETKGTSFEKGESLEDTLLNLHALGLNVFVIRTNETGGLDAFRRYSSFSVVNAGDGTGEHPTQALLDLCTLLKARAGGRGLEGLKGFRLGILGDLTRSRVARSWSELAPRVGIELSLISPAAWKPTDWQREFPWTDDKRKGLQNLDALMVLRVQKERMALPSSLASNDSRTGEIGEFSVKLQIQKGDLTGEQLLLHPGPVNWGVELAHELRSDPRSLILEQVKSGLAVRSVVLDSVENG